MRRTLPILAGATLTLCSAGVAEAQDRSLGRGIQFVLKPRSGMAIRSAAAPLDAGSQERMTRLAAVPVRDRGHELKMTVSRRKLRFAGPMLTPSSGFGPRSRMVLLTIEDRVSAGDQVTIMAGAQGGKLSNRGANVTAIASSGRIRTRDWFMPRATVEITPLPALNMALDYRETWRAYGETGGSGPMGLRDDEFRTWAGTLKAETRHRLRFNSSWTPSPETALTLAAIDGAVDNRLSFARRSYLPVNIGSARLTGLELAAVHQASPHWRLSMRYSKAWVDRADEGQAGESRLSAEAGWSTALGAAWSARRGAAARRSPPSRGPGRAPGPPAAPTGRRAAEGSARCGGRRPSRPA